MAYSNPRSASGDQNTKGRSEGGLTGELPSAAQRTLDEIADALSVTTSLLYQGAQSELLKGGPVSLMEASTLQQAFIRIQDPAVRQRCLAFVQDEASRK